MTTQQLSAALELAQSDADLSRESIGHFDGYGLNGFEPVLCTVQQVARLVRWQCIQLNGATDADALNELAQFGRRRFIVVGKS
jgi:hypothetical protein